MNPYLELAALHKALAHPIRLRIVDILSREEACVCHLTAAVGQRQPYVSQQLAILREAGLVADRREGTLIYYRLRDQYVAEMLALGKRLALALEESEARFPSISDEPLPDCPCPRCRSAAVSTSGVGDREIARI